MGNLIARHAHLPERFVEEMDFVEGLMELHPAEAPAWKQLTERAVGIVNPALEAGDLKQIDAAVLETEKILAPIGKIAKSYTIHCVGHAHIDMNWMWSWPETVQIVNDTFKTVLKLMEEFPDFCFTQSQASIYQIVERYNPKMLEQIRQRVKQGRWEIAASHWVEGDHNLASGESLVRHMLYTRRYLKDLFGLEPADIPIEWAPDTFGHAHTIPSINVRGGVRRMYLCRGGAGWAKPPVFWFQGPDGSRVLVNHETTWYNDFIAPHNVKSLLNFSRLTGLRESMNVYGVGDHGGGPTRRDLIRCGDLDSWPIFPNFKLATSRAYFDLLEKHGEKWPTLDRELNYEFPGCYTSQSSIKRNNRLSEIYATQAEWTGVLAARLGPSLGVEYPQQELVKLWRDVCFNHFHDILPGSGVPATRTYNDGMFQRIAASAGTLRTNALRAVAAQVDTRCSLDWNPAAIAPEQQSVAFGAGSGHKTMIGGTSAAGFVTDGPRPFVVFNTVAAQRDELISALIWDPQTGENAGELADKNYIIHLADGRTIPAQTVKSGEWYWTNKFVEVVFPITVGSLGYTTCVAVDDGTRPKPPVGAFGYEKIIQAAPQEGGVRMLDVKMGVEAIAVGGFAMENDLLLVEFDAQTGGIKKLVDKKSGVNFAKTDDPMGVVEVAWERGGGMSAWVIHDTFRKGAATIKSLRKLHGGPWIGAIEAKATAGNSEVTITYTMQANQPWIEIKVETRWLEIGSAGGGIPKLQMKFPMALADASARYEIPFGSIARTEHEGEEVPGLRWADVTGQIAVGSRPQAGTRSAVGSNNATSSLPTADSRLQTSTGGCALLNDSKYGHSLTGDTLRLTLIRSSYDPDPIPEVGDHAIRMALVPHAANLSVAQLVKLGAAFNEPLQVISTDLHAGALPPAASAAGVTPDTVILSSIKKAEDSDDLIFRLFEADGKTATAKVQIDPRVLGKAVEATEVDFLERPTASSSARISAGGFEVNIAPHAIASVKVKLAGV
jgi:alpha-mannosidase